MIKVDIPSSMGVKRFRLLNRRGAPIMSMCLRGGSRTNMLMRGKFFQWQESQNRPPSTMFVRMLARTSVKRGSSGQHVLATLLYIRTEIPVIIVFRALGFVADTQMMELLRSSLEEAFVIENQQIVNVPEKGARKHPLGENIQTMQTIW